MRTTKMRQRTMGFYLYQLFYKTNQAKWRKKSMRGSRSLAPQRSGHKPWKKITNSLPVLRLQPSSLASIPASSLTTASPFTEA